MSPQRLDEEARGLLRQILERQTYRQIVAGNIRGHGLQFLPELDVKLRFTAELGPEPARAARGRADLPASWAAAIIQVAREAADGAHPLPRSRASSWPAASP